MNKAAIKNFAIWARVNLITAVQQRAFQYETTEGGENKTGLETVGGRLLTPDEKKQREQLICQIRSKGYAQVMEEVAYTWFNRFIALRFMEVNGYLPSRVRVFTDENNKFKPQILAEATNLELDGMDREKVYTLKNANDDDALFKYLVIVQCNALSPILPVMFQRIADYTELLFPDNLLRKGSVIQQMIELIPEEDWTDQVQIIGWLYQYYNSVPKDTVFANLKKNIKIRKEDIPAATQLFTPDWIVRYMVENSLGRVFVDRRKNEGSFADGRGLDDMTWEEAEKGRIANETYIAKQMGWEYYLPEAEQTREVREQLNEIQMEHAKWTVQDIKVMDPCMGSGHILVYAFDVLMQIYEHYGYNARDAVASIVQNNLYGLDIDDRAAQLAYFAVMMKARQYDRRFLSRKNADGYPDVPQPHVYEIVESNGIDPNAIGEFVGGDPALKKAMDSILKEMRDAKEYGSILNITPVDFDALYTRFDQVYDGFCMSREIILGELLPMVRVAETLARKYDVVVTNPPYMSSSGMSGKLGCYLKNNYPDSKSDMYAAFIEKCGRMLKINGYQAMITQHTWMFIGTYENLRSIVYRNNIINLVHLGIKAFEEIGNDIVQTCAFVLNYTRVKDYASKFVRLVDCKDFKLKEKEFLSGGHQNVSTCGRLTKIPGKPLAYWVGDQFIENFARGKSVEKYGSFTGSQNITGDNERFLRYHWEINSSGINKRWFFYAKGGDYRQYYGNLDLVIDWSTKARNFYQNNKTSNLLNREYWFLEGITYSAITSRGTGFRYLPSGCLFDKGGPSINVKENLHEVLALFNSNVAKYYFWVFNPSINLQVKDVKNFPIIFSENHNIAEMAKRNTDICEDDWNSFETASGFKKHPLI